MHDSELVFVLDMICNEPWDISDILEEMFLLQQMHLGTSMNVQDRNNIQNLFDQAPESFLFLFCSYILLILARCLLFQFVMLVVDY